MMMSNDQAPGTEGLTRGRLLKRAGAAVAVTAAPALFAGQGASALAASRKRAGGAKLTMWWWGQQEANGLNKFLPQSLAMYSKAHAGVSVKSVLQATQSLIPGFTAACQTKHGPDIQYQWGCSYSMQFAWENCITPISDLLPKSELNHVFKTNLDETLYNGKVYGLPWYTAPVVLFYSKPAFTKAGLDPEAPPRTWDAFVAAMGKLRTAGYIPWGYGVQGLTGIGVFNSLFNLQDLDNPTDVLNPVVGSDAYTSPKYSTWLSRVEELIKAKAFNDDVTSLAYYDSQNLLVSGKAAMAVGVGTQIGTFAAKLGKANLGVMLPPLSGQGKLAGKMPNTSQQLFVTSFASNKDDAAQVLAYLHTPERLAAMYKMSGAIPPDNRFNPKSLSLPQQRQVFGWMKTSATTDYQNYWPAQEDRENLFLAIQALFSNQSTASKAASDVEGRLKSWRQLNGSTAKTLQKWAASGA
jgi:ABC-type glycerol-3-phosphate transport system substrate-binding protein